MKRSAILLLFLVSLMLACRSSEELTIEFPECEGNDTYGVDALLVSGGNNLWSYLSTADGVVVHEQAPPVVFSPTFFINKEAACEEEYTLSIGRLDQEDFGAGLATYLRMDQVAEVPDGSALTMFRWFDPQRTAFYKEDELIKITHCPPVDSVYLPYAEGQLGFNSNTTFFYYPADSVLSIATAQGYAGSLDGLLGLRTTYDQAWQGELIDLSGELVDTLDFRALPQLNRRSISVQTEGEVERLEVHLLTGGSTRRTVLLGSVKANQMDMLLPLESFPFQLEIITTGPDYDYELKRRYTKLPPEIDLRTPLLSLSSLSLNQPDISFNASGADVVRLRSNIVIDVTTLNSVYHSFTGPAQEGTQDLRLPDLAPSLADNFNGTEAYYNRSFEGGTLELMHYPGINGDYRIFLRKIMGSSLAQDWMLQEEYEKLRVSL